MDWSYVAGFTDADGYIGMGVRIRESGWRNRWFAVKWGQCEANRATLDALTEFLRAEGITAIYADRPSPRNHQHVYEVTVGAMDDVEATIERMHPFLVLKAARAETVLSTLRAYRAGDERIADARMRATQSAGTLDHLPRRLDDVRLIPIEELRRLRHEGASLGAIGRAWGRSPATIKRWIDEHCPDVSAKHVDLRKGRYDFAE